MKNIDKKVLEFYKERDYYTNDLFSEYESHYYRDRDYYYFGEILKVVKEILNSNILSIEELSKDESIRFSIIIDAFNLDMKDKDSSNNNIKEIIKKYKDIFLELGKNREIRKNLTNYHKNTLKKLKDFFDPNNNLNFVEFKNYDNSIAMIAFLNGHISKGKVTQTKARKILNKVLLKEKYSYSNNIDYSKAITVMKYCINNLTPYLNQSDKTKMFKFILENIPNSTSLFFDAIKKYPNNYLPILFDKNFYIRLFDIFSDEELDYLIKGIKNREKATEFMLNKANILANKLFTKPNSGGPKILLKGLKSNPNNPNIPYFRDIIETLNKIHTNLKNILLKLGYIKNEY